MLSRERADKVGDAIIEQARLGTLRRPWRPVRIPLLYRCQALNSLPRSLQQDVVRQAGQELAKSWSFNLFLLAWGCVATGAYWALTMALYHASDLLGPFVAVNCGVLLLLRGLFMRRRVRAIAIRLQ